jgi:hypothetical protein
MRKKTLMELLTKSQAWFIWGGGKISQSPMEWN